MSGIALIVLFAILASVVHLVVYSVVNPNTSQGILIAFEGVLAFVKNVLPPVGAALLSAGLVVRHLDQHAAIGRVVQVTGQERERAEHGASKVPGSWQKTDAENGPRRL